MRDWRHECRQSRIKIILFTHGSIPIYIIIPTPNAAFVASNTLPCEKESPIL
jgi:hypothetical protein